MEYEYTHQPSFTHLLVTLEEGESFLAEPGAMVSHTPNVSLKTESSGSGLLGAAKSMMGGESAFVNRFTAEDSSGTLTLAPPSPGDIKSHELQGETLYAIDGAFLAGTEGIEIDSELGGIKSILGGASLTPLALKGDGTAFIDAYGGLDKIELDRGESYVIDNGHIVAWDDQIDFTTESVGGLKSSVVGGEGLVFEFTGPGTAWYQTRDMDSLVDVITSKLPDEYGD